VVFVATDFSPAARRAVARAALLGRGRATRLVLFNALEIPPESLEALGGDASDLARHFHGQLEREMARAPVAGAGLRTEADFRFGKPFVEIVRAARESGAELIVLGARGEAGLRAAGIGATAEKVVRKADRPVLVVRRPAPEPYGKVLVAVDFSEHARFALETAYRLAPGAELHLLHVHGAIPGLWLSAPLSGGRRGRRAPRDGREQEQQLRAEMDDFLSNAPPGRPEPRLHFRRGSPEDVVPAVARSLRAELLALGTHGRTGLAHALLGSVAERVVRDAGCDVLVARPGAHAFHLP
jgi:nucleotide-binding universal stress UspA family protein